MPIKDITEAEAWDDHFRKQDLSGVDLVGHPDFVAFEVDDQVKDGWDSLTEAAGGSGIITGAVKAASDWFNYDQTDAVDPNWNPVKFMEQDEFFQNIMTRADNIDSPYDREFLDAALESKNEHQFDAAYRRYRRDMANLEAWDENPWAAGFGTVLGIAPDIAASILIPMGLPAAVGVHASRLTGAGLAMRSVMAARGVAAARVATYGGAEGLGDTAMHDLTRTMLQDDYIWTTLMGAGVGAMLGGIAPTVIGRVGIDFQAWKADTMKVMRKDEADRAAREASDYVHETNPVGSAPSPKKDTADQALELEIAANPFVAMGRLVEATSRTIGRGYALISPKTLIAQYFVLAAKFKGTQAGEALSNVANVTGRMFQPNVVFKHNVLGEGRVMSMTDILNEMDAYRTSRMMEVGEQTSVMYKVIKEHYGLTDKARSKSDTIDTIARKMGHSAERMPDQNDLWKMADQIAHMKRLNEERAAMEVAEGAEPPRMITEDEVWHSVENMRSIPAELRDDIWKMADDISTADDAFFKAAEERLVNAGLVEAAEMIPHYRSQLWNQDRVAENGPRFRNMVYRILEKEPEAEWVNHHWFREAPEGDDAVPSGTFWEEGESWADVYKRDPETAEEVLEEWGFAVRNTKIEDLKARRGQIQEVLDDYQVKDAAELETRFGKQVDDLNRWIDNNETKLAKLQAEKANDPTLPIDGKMAEIENRIVKYNIRLMHKEDNIKQLNDALGQVEELSRLQGKFKTKSRAKTKTQIKKLRKTDENISATQAGTTVHELVKELQESIGTGSAARITDLPMDRMRSGNSRLMKRMLHLKEEQFSDDAAFFLSSGPEVGMTQYTHTVGRRLAFIEAMQPYLNKMRPGTRLDGTEADITTLNGILNDEFEAAKRAHAGDAKMLRMLTREQTKTRQFVKEQLEGWNNIGLNDQRLGGWMEVVLGGTAAHSLGTVVVTQGTDIPTAMMALPGNAAAGAFTGSLIKNLGKTGSTLRNTLEEIKADDYLMFSALRGLNAYETSRWEKMVDTRSVADQLDDVHSGANTGKLGIARSITREAGKLQAYATLAPSWNKWVQTSFGHVFLDAMNDGILNWKALKQIDKEHYARLGLGERQAATMRKLLLDPKMTRQLGPDGKMRIPIKEAWPDDVYGQYLGVIRRAQNEALIAPEIGDMPALVMRHPMARLIYQFSSFAFAWSGQVMRKAIQRGRMHPSMGTTLGPLVTGMAFGAMVMYIKNVLVYGKTHDEVMSKPLPDLIWDTMSRTPFVTGMGNSLMESMFLLSGRGINSAAGLNILPEEPNYFKRQQGLAGLLGPAFGLMSGTYFTAMQQAADGDHEKAMARIMTQLPILNTIGLKPIINLYGDD